MDKKSITEIIPMHCVTGYLLTFKKIKDEDSYEALVRVMSVFNASDKLGSLVGVRLPIHLYPVGREKLDHSLVRLIYYIEDNRKIAISIRKIWPGEIYGEAINYGVYPRAFC